jgi:nucleoid-associated protein YgaU
MAYIFYLDNILLPVAPSKLQMKIANKNKTVTLINDGEINILKTPGLTEVEFEIMIPQVKYPFAVYKNGYFLNAKYFLDKFEKLKREKKPFQFIVSRTTPDGKPLFDTNNNMTFSLEEYAIVEDANQGMDLMVSIKLKQYKKYGTQIITVKKISNKTTKVKKIKTRYSNKSIPKTYTVKPGDSLWAICKKLLGDGEKCYEIAKKNNIKPANRIYAGMVIKLG